MPQMAYCKSLQALYLAHNELEGFEPHFLDSHMTEVKEIDMSNNKLKEIPTELKRLSKCILGIDLRNNQITKITLKDYTTLKILDLSGNQIEVIDHQINTLKALEKLRLSYNKIYAIHEDAFKELDSLKELRLDNNELTYLPQFLIPNSLKYLTLRYNNIEELPDDLFFPTIYEEERAEKKKENSKFDNLPDPEDDEEEEEEEKEKKKVTEQENKKEEQKIPEKSISLEHLDVSYNQLIRFPRCNKTLKKLNVSHNKIQKFPEHVTNLIYLEQFSCQGNPFMKEWSSVKELSKTENVVKNIVDEANSDEEETEGEGAEANNSRSRQD
eukprot:CAMPEP_0117420488 /NCGR_PEP_ID=MMETSP0758-20121206/1810_1 /TAXON_ID=63605 /ORGANISM="Percolomonas cosmopolitus, Strain AE-1 (ATCC 50343)" /LENGTH=326 /DNA_ID=CAMNT_0005202123 /DNA_START=790 /DNA_END=1767 /DNA_ORIENTATION=+